MKTGKKFWSLLLALIMVVSLMGGMFTVGAAEGPFEADTALLEGREYVVATEYEGKYYAFAYDGGLTAVEVTVADGAIAEAPEAAIWLVGSSNTVESVASPGTYVYAGSSGLMTYTSGRAFVYDADAQVITMHSVPYYLTFDGEKFSQSSDAADACKIEIFGRGEAIEPEPLYSLEDYIPPETVKRDAVKNEDGSINLAFTSDVHNDGEHLNIQTWLEYAEAEFGYIDAMGICGDMGSAYASSAATYWPMVQVAIDYLDSEIDAGDIGDVIYTTGNHEWFTTAGGDYGHEYFTGNYPATQRFRIVGEGLVTDSYIIYCFGAGESTGYQGTLGDYRYLQNEIDVFAEWLETAPTDIPIFVLTHYPLHKWGGRGEERMQANAAEIIDILNEHPNLVVLWGHNHSNYDDNYYEVYHPGDSIVIDADNNTKEINFTYASAGATADIEYTGPEAGSAACMNKGLIVTINADGTLDFTYYTIDGQQMTPDAPWMVRIRGGFGNYEVFDTQYVEDGGLVTPVDPPEVEGYFFSGWYQWRNGVETLFDFSQPITQNTLITAKYRFDTGLDPDFVYVTIQSGDHIVVGKSGTPLLMYPVPYVEGMTVIDAVQALQDVEYEGTTNVGTGGYGYVTDVWGWNPANGTWMMQPGAKNCYVTASSPVEAANSYYVLTYEDSADSAYTSYLLPYAANVKAGEPISFSGGYWTFSMTTYKYTDNPIAGDVYIGVSLDDMYDTGIDAVDGAFELAIPYGGTFYVAVKAEGIGLAATRITVAGDPIPGTAPIVVASRQKLKVNGEEKITEVYNISGNNYFKLRDLAALLTGTGSQFSVDYDKETRTVIVKTGEAYTLQEGDLTVGEDKSATAVPSNQTIMIDGVAVELEVYNIGGNNFFQLRAMGEVLGFDVDYDAPSFSMLVTSK